MAFRLQTIDHTKLYSSIVEQVLEGIRSGAYPARGALPAERMLASQLGVSRASVREAIRVLEHAGVLEVRTGSGTYVSPDALSRGTALRARAMSVGDHSPLDVIVARRALELASAEQAALHRHASDLTLLGELVERQAGIDRAGENPGPVDLEFHIAISAASHNSALQMLMEHLGELMREGTWKTLGSLQLRHSGRGGDYVAQHRAILEAIVKQDGAAARQAMHEHLDAVESALLLEVD